MTDTDYAYRPDSPDGDEHHTAMEELFDPRSEAYLLQRLPQPGWLVGKRCLELAAGAGGFARRLVGAGGLVLATDLHPQRLLDVEGMRYDLNDPLPHGPWDLIHVRLGLGHLRFRRTITKRIAEATAPGGLVMIEDLLPTPPDHIVATAPDDELGDLIRLVQRAHRLVLQQHGVSATWAWEAHEAMVDAGLVKVRREVWGTDWVGGGAGCRFLAACLAQLTPELVGTGTVDHVDCARVIQALREEPKVVLNGHLLVSLVGFRPDQFAA